MCIRDSAGVSLAVVAPDDGLLVHGDPDRLAQVITNLLGNALTATPSGQVRVVAERTGDDAVVSVVDTGVGLDPADLTRVFERFYRAPGTGACLLYTSDAADDLTRVDHGG